MYSKYQIRFTQRWLIIYCLSVLSSRHNWAALERALTGRERHPARPRRPASSCARCSAAMISRLASRDASPAAPPPACALPTRVRPRASGQRFRSRVASSLAGNSLNWLFLFSSLISFLFWEDKCVSSFGTYVYELWASISFITA